MKGFLASLCVLSLGVPMAYASAVAAPDAALDTKPVVQEKVQKKKEPPVALQASGVDKPVVSEGAAGKLSPLSDKTDGKEKEVSVTAALPGAAEAKKDTAKKASHEGLEALINDLAILPVTMDTLPFVSRESVGVQDATSLGVSMWRGTMRPVARLLIDDAQPTASPVLNELVLRVFKTAAVPPEGQEEKGGDSLVAARVKALVRFGDAQEALALARQADPSLIDGAVAHLAVNNAFLAGQTAVCKDPATLIKAYPKENWQKFLILCAMQAKDKHAAQVALDVLRAEKKKDSLFLSVAEKNVLGKVRSLPLRIDPDRDDLLGLMQMAGLSVSRRLFSRVEPARAQAFLRIPNQNDSKRLALAERAAAVGLIGVDELGEVYASVSFSAEELAAPLVTREKGASLRALLYQAAKAESAKDQSDVALKIAFVTRFVDTAGATFLNGAGGILWSMLGVIPVDAALEDKAVSLATFYMLAGKNEVAKAWLDSAMRTNKGVTERDTLWPLFVLSGMMGREGEAFTKPFATWFDGRFKSADDKVVRTFLMPVLLYFEAAGLPVPNAVWPGVFVKGAAKEKTAFSPLVLERLRHAAAEGRRAEAVLLAAQLEAEAPESLTVSLAIVRALRQVGLADAALRFARDIVAQLVAKAA